MSRSAVVLPSVTVTLTPTVVVPSSSVAENENWWTPICASAGVQLNVVAAVPVPLAAGAVAPDGRPEADRATASPSPSVAVTVKLRGLPNAASLLVPAGSSAIVGGWSATGPSPAMPATMLFSTLVLKACASVA
jgi:hypothetical protein